MRRKSLEPWIKDTVDYYDFQVIGIRKLYVKPNFILGDDMGLGKTLQALTVFTMDVVSGRGDTALVVAPVTLKGNWADEIKEFTRFPHIVLGQKRHPTKPGRFLTLGQEEREMQIFEFFSLPSPKILIVNYEQIKSHLELINKLKFHTVIFDEAHYLKNHKAARTKACLQLEAKRKFMLTGTPMLNHIPDLWTLLHLTNPRQWPKYWIYINRYAVFGGFQGKQITSVKNEEELKERLQSVMIRRLSKDVLDLQEPRYIKRRVDLHPEQQKLYDQLEEDQTIDIDSMTVEEIENSLTKFLRHKQICCTTATVLGQDRDYSYKLDLAAEDALELVSNGHRVGAFTQFRPGIVSFQKRLAKLGIQTWEIHGGVGPEYRTEIVKQWGSAKPGVLICQSAVGGVGLNMTAGRHCLLIDKLFSPGLNQQIIKRFDRIGSDITKAVQVYEYICRGTVENRVEQILRIKTKLSDDIVEMEDFKRKLLRLLAEKEVA